MEKKLPSGPAWEKYRAAELEHWKEHGKGSGNYYEWNGQRWRLDRKNGRGSKVRYSPKSVDAKNFESKSKFSIRNQRIKGQTSPLADPVKTKDFIAKANAQNLEHHHNAPIARVDSGLGKKYGYPLPKEVHTTHNKQGVYFGDDVRNYTALSKQDHTLGDNSVHRQYDNLDDGIARAKGSFKGLNIRPGGLPKLVRQGFRGSTLSLALDIVEAVDAQTNGAINNTINNGVNYLRSGIENGVNGFVERYQKGLNNIADVAVKNGLFGLPTLSIDGQPDYGQKGL